MCVFKHWQQSLLVTIIWSTFSFSEPFVHSIILLVKLKFLCGIKIANKNTSLKMILKTMAKGKIFIHINKAVPSLLFTSNNKSVFNEIKRVS